MSRSRKEASLLATAAWVDLQSQTLALSAAVMRGAGRDEIEQRRQRAHDTLDGVLDLNQQVGDAVRADQLD